DAVVAAVVVLGPEDRVADRARRALRVAVPDHRRGRAGEHGEAGQQTTEHAMADDEFGRLVRAVGGAARDRVVGRGGQREQHAALAELVADGHHPVTGHRHARGGATEQAADLTEA
ncbi:MAG: hypothetical protein ACK559_13140, partial [bacterium]